MSKISFEITELDHPIESTYDYLVKLLQEKPDLPSGTVIHTDYQTAGRGQLNNSWFSSPRLNALPSIYLRLHRPLQQIWSISEATAIAVYKSCQKQLSSEDTIEIKWPNDIFVNDHKIAGILIHNALAEGSVAETIIGIGMNINEGAFPPELPQAISLRLVTGQTYDVKAQLRQMLRHLGEQLARQDYAALHAEYNDLLYQRGIPARYRDVATEEEFDATIKEVSPQGQLVLTTAKGEERRYAFKEIVYL